MARSLACLLLVLGLVGAASAEIKLQQVDRKIGLNSQFAKITEQIKAKNTGSQTESAVVVCQFVRPGAVIAHVKAVDSSKAQLKVTPTAVASAPADVSCFSVALPSPLAAGETAGFTFRVVLAKAQTAFPAEVNQLETQMMIYTDSVYIPSPYTVSAQTTEVSMPGAVQSYTDTEKPANKDGRKVHYGKYDLIKPFTIKELKVHFENPKAFKHVLSYVKEIEVSHWGNIYVEESYELKNSGAKHVNAFSRLKYGHTVNGKGNSFRELKAHLPASAHSLYYVDLIGNISTSNVRKTATETIVDFEARYPLMGGWKVDFTLGYSVPLTGFLFRKRSDGKYRLTMDLSVPLDDVFVEDLTVRVVLPEGAHHIAASLPYDVEQSFDTKFTYLDTTGRPVLVLHKKNVVTPEHTAKFSVEYSFAPSSMLREPLILVTGFFCLLLAVVVYNRLEFTLTKDEKWLEAQTREKLATVMEQLQALLEEKEEVLARLGKAAASVQGSGDAERANKERSAVDKRVKELDDKVAEHAKAVAATSQRVAAQVVGVVTALAGLHERYGKLLAERVDLAKKGTAPQELNRRLSASNAALEEAKKDVLSQIDNVFAAY